MKRATELKTLIAILAVLAGLLGGYDFWLVFSHKLDGGHVPFLIPVFLGGFAFALWSINGQHQ